MKHELTLLKHQAQLVNMPWQEEYRGVEYWFLIGGYASGKSTAAVALILSIAGKYNGHQVTCAVFSTTITLFRKTIWQELSKALIMGKIPHRYDKQENVIYIGSVKFVVIPTENPTAIYGVNSAISIVDEIDELEQSRAMLAFEAVQERTRVPLPDGRRPFTVFTTTAQGMRGVYQITEDLREKALPFVIIRGRTELNTFLDPAYYQRLYALYDENEREAYLNGEFVNLTSGRCYPAFNERDCVVNDMMAEDLETVSVGQDMNSAASCANAVIKRAGTLYVIKEFCFKDFTMAAEDIRRDFPSQEIPYYPDASGKMIIQAQMSSFMQAGMDVKQANINPPISERVFIVNKMLATGRLKVCKSVKNLILAWKTRCYDDNGKPQKAAVHPEASDFCDSLEYVVFRMVSADPDFFDLYSMVRNHGR